MMEHLDLSELIRIHREKERESKRMRSLALASFFLKLNELLKQPFSMEQIKEEALFPSLLMCNYSIYVAFLFLFHHFTLSNIK